MLLVIGISYAAISISLSLIFFAVLVRNSLPVAPSAVGFAFITGVSVALARYLEGNGRSTTGDRENTAAVHSPLRRRWFRGIYRDLPMLIFLSVVAGFQIRLYFKPPPAEAERLMYLFLFLWMSLLYCCAHFVRWWRSAALSEEVHEAH